MPAATTESPTKKQRKKQQRKALAEDSRLVLSSPDALPKPSTHVFTRVFVTAPVDPPIESWTDERLPACFAQFNAKAGHTSLRPVQAWLWANLLSGLDAVAIAPTGSGKTLAYALPLVPHILASTQRGGGPVALILAPTRELVAQIAKVCAPFKRMFDIVALAAYGGGTETGAGENACDILVCTPMRVVDLACRFLVSLAHVTIVVVDEADRLVSMGFREQVQWVMDHTRGDKQLCLTSATMEARAADVCLAWLREGYAMRALGSLALGRGEEDRVTLCGNVAQTVHVCAEHKKPRKLIRYVTKVRAEEGATRRPGPMLVFCTKIKTVKFVVEFLQQHKVRVASIRGDMPQAARERALRDFRAGKFTTLVATDVAARGLDLPALSHVVSYDFPPSLPMYAHRVGRAARGEGQTGTALSFFTRNLSRMAPDLVRMLENAGQSVDHHLRRLASDVAEQTDADGDVPSEADSDVVVRDGVASSPLAADDDDVPAEDALVESDGPLAEEEEEKEEEDDDDDDDVNTDAQVFGVAPLVPFSARVAAAARASSSSAAPKAAAKRKRPRGKRGGASNNGGKRAKRHDTDIKR